MSKSYDADLALYINGSWKSSEGRDMFPVIDPALGETIAEVPLASPADLDEALDAADKGFVLWRATPVEQRAAVLRKTADLLRERADAIARLLTLEQGKPLAEARAEVVGSAALFDWCAAEAVRIYGRVLVRPTGQRSMINKQPIGPVAAFSPWNFPISLMAKKIASALAVGCSVIAKPPEETPGCTGALVRCLADAGLPAGVVQLVHGVPDAVSRHLLASPVIRKVSFTGSVPVGRHLMRLAADGLKRVTMELGGHA
ncbi:MAG: aldehyde dehydrogenase family protein, partial [Sphingomonadales bacterium]|nr:aldehyde dehydrogenase family protein [Sphingomonadaceae bacterium]MBS3930942.1 aldehyde dehydrogenase family protein [Sphingomonadales bacterium]